jgi:hypothetical protein
MAVYYYRERKWKFVVVGRNDLIIESSQKQFVEPWPTDQNFWQVDASF